MLQVRVLSALPSPPVDPIPASRAISFPASRDHPAHLAEECELRHHNGGGHEDHRCLLDRVWYLARADLVIDEVDDSLRAGRGRGACLFWLSAQPGSSCQRPNYCEWTGVEEGETVVVERLTLIRPLSPFEHLVCREVCRGKTNAAIARDTHHTEKAVETAITRTAKAFGIVSGPEVNVRVLMALNYRAHFGDDAFEEMGVPCRHMTTDPSGRRVCARHI